MLAGDRSRWELKETVMNRIRHIRRIAAMLAGLATVLLAWGATPAFAMQVPPPNAGGGVAPGSTGTGLPPAQLPPVIHTVTRTVVAGGMPGWQIALIAAGAALLAAALAVLADRSRAAHRKTALPAA
jgi:hypothetical protein